MQAKTDSFTTRQEMRRPDFEFFHSINSRPIDVQSHRHDFYEVFYFLSGVVDYIIEGRTYHLRPGDILLTNNQELHRPVVKEGRLYERVVFWFQPAYIRGLGGGGDDLSLCFEASSQRHFNLLRPMGEAGQELRRIVRDMEEAYTGDAYGSASLRAAYCAELLVWLNRAYFSAPADIGDDLEYDPKINEVARYINANLCGDLSLDTLSARFYISKYHLTRQFKKYLGFSLHQYIVQKRLVAARLALLSGKSAGEAFEESGFTDYANFSRTFRENYGIPPRDYRPPSP